jgi:tetratricopeptide (TPR) repeat protein
MDASQPPSAAPGRLAKLMAMLERTPDDAFCLYGVAQEHARAGRHTEALAWYDRACVADPDGAYAFFHKARSQQALGDEPAAIETLRAGLAAARRGKDSHAAGEIAGFLAELGAEEAS